MRDYSVLLTVPGEPEPGLIDRTALSAVLQSFYNGEEVMAKKRIRLLDTVALLGDLPGRKLKRGEVGTVVEVLAPNVYEVEFCDEEGQTYAEFALRGDQIMVLHNQGEVLKIVA
jgi:hypothetical protein